MKRPSFIVGIALLLLSAVFMIAGLCLFIVPPQYKSMARISIEEDANNPVGSDSKSESDVGFGGGPWDPTEIEKLYSKAVLFQVISNLDLNRKWGERLKEGVLRTDVTYPLIKRQLTVRLGRGSHLIEIGVMSDDPTEASSIANSVAQVYVGQRELKRREARKRAETLVDHLIIADSSPGIVDSAEPDFVPVKPNPVIKVVFPLTGLLSGVAGLILFAFHYRRSATSTAAPRASRV